MVGCFALPSGNKGWGWGLALPQVNVFNSPWEALPFLRTAQGWVGGSGEVGEKGRKVEQPLVYKMNEKYNKTYFKRSISTS